MVERVTVNDVVAGSSPASSAILRDIPQAVYWDGHRVVERMAAPPPPTRFEDYYGY